MKKEEKTIRIFTGSSIEAQPLLGALHEAAIHPIIKDDHQSGILSGFATGIPGQIRVYIRREELERAQVIIDNYTNSKN